MKMGGCALGALILGAGCSTEPSNDPASRVNGSSGATPSSVASSRSPVAPHIPDLSSRDLDRDRIDDSINTSLIEDVAVEAVFSKPMPADAVARFEAAGGKIRHVLHHIGYGFTGFIPRSAIARVVPELGPDLVLVKEEQKVVMHLDEVTRTSRARAVWAPGFAGSTNGFNGSSKVNIAIVDSGVDASHADLAGRMIGYKDFTTENVAEPKDMLGHGTHLAGLALGSGASFGMGPGTLSVTETADASDPSDPLAEGDFYPFSMHLPATFNIKGTATFEGTATFISFLRANDGSLSWTDLGKSAATTSPLSFDYDNSTGGPSVHFTLGLRQNAAKDLKNFAIASKISPYPAVGDGFPALRGVAPQSGYYAAKIFPASGFSDSGTITAALDEIDAIHESLDIKIVNCSFGAGDSALRAKVQTLVSHGLIVVASSGNTAAVGGTTIYPGLTPEALTVGATSDVNLLTRYSTGRTRLAGEAEGFEKPDILAPGGSVYRSKVLAPDTNSSDAYGSNAIADIQKDDYTSLMGTSMAAPIVAGGAALVIQALESKGYTWDYKSSDSVMLVKMLLLATSTETNQLRESNFDNPALGRAPAPKDSREGYGLLNLDAAIEAATLIWDFKDPITGTTSTSPSDRRAWARKVHVKKGDTVKLALTAPATADFDVHLYLAKPGASGAPRLEAWSAKAGLGVNEKTTWTFFDEQDLYVVVKRIEGTGTFTLTGATYPCGDGKVDPGEECDDKNIANGDCCNAGCQIEQSPACLADAGIDAGAPDSGTADAGTKDADAPTPDASTPPPDTSKPTPSPSPAPTSTTPAASPPSAADDDSGCSMTTAESPSFAGIGLALACALVLRRRRTV